jgi:peptide/nickel transport system permease protein
MSGAPIPPAAPRPDPSSAPDPARATASMGHRAPAAAAPPPPPSPPDAVLIERVLSPGEMVRRRFAKHRLAVFSFYTLAVLYAVALLAEFFAPHEPSRVHPDHLYSPPVLARFDFSHGFHFRHLMPHTDPVSLRVTYATETDRAVRLRFLVRGEPYRLWGIVPLERRFIDVDPAAVAVAHAAGELPPRWFPLGTDRFGHDVFSRILHGARVSLSIGLVGIAVTLVIGLAIGGVSGYVGGQLDNVIQRGIEIINALPQLPLWLAISAAIPAEWPPVQTYFAIVVVLSLLNWTGLARVVRGKLLALREEDYAVAARLIGASHARIIAKHLLPGLTSHIIVVLTLSVPGMILGETALSFLGLGLQPPVVSWGMMLQDCFNLQNVANHPWLLAPVFFVIATVVAYNFLGDGLRDAADPYASH